MYTGELFLTLLAMREENNTNARREEVKVKADAEITLQRVV